MTNRDPSQRQEKFLRLVAEGKPANQSYQEVYQCAKSTSNVNSYKLLRRPHIKRWLDKYKAEAGRRNDVTVDEVISNIRKAVKGALAEGKWTDVIGGSKALGSYIGMDRQTLSELGDHNPFQKGMSDVGALSRISKIANSRGETPLTETSETEGSS